MPSQQISSVENNFTKGLITEFTGLNFPENAATDTDNCVYSLVGDVTRRLGIDFEENYGVTSIPHNSAGINYYKWNNAGGDGTTQLVVIQIGTALYFYRSSTATPAAPLSNQALLNPLNLTSFTVSNQIFDFSQECQFADGNGYLFVFHPSCEPFYVTYSSSGGGSIAAYLINVQIRDLIGVLDNAKTSDRPSSLDTNHQYNLQNQGWQAGNGWYAISNDSKALSTTGSVSWNIGVITGPVPGQIVTIQGNIPGSPAYVTASGPITSYAAGVITINLTSISNINHFFTYNVWSFRPINVGYINTWQAANGVFPSNADVWWYFKDGSGAFNPAATTNNVTLATGNAPRGHYIFSAFNMDRSSISGVINQTLVTTSARPTTGAWFQGRVWYSGVNDSFQRQGNSDFYSWSSNIYFSQIVTSPGDFGNCFQTNDPTSEDLFGILPSDGGVITIPQAGAILKLFPIQNGLIVFATNGVWFITGSQGIGFTANDYTIVQLSEVKGISKTSYVNVLGLPYFWNEEGIYQVTPNQNGSLTVEPITVGTILTFYNNIPLPSRKYARGTYDPLEYTITWVYRSSPETSVNDRYNYDRALNYNTYNKAFFPYTFTGSANVFGALYVAGPGNIESAEPAVKFPTFSGSNLTFSEIRDEDYVDFKSVDGGANYESFFVTGYKVHGKGQHKFQVPYIFMYSRNVGDFSDGYTAYKIQGIWDYANDPNTGRWSRLQFVEHNQSKFTVIPKKIPLRGRGYTLQIKLTSVDGKPFDIIGWSTYETQNAGV